MCLWWYTILYIIQYNIPLAASACYICIECRVYVYTIPGIQYAITRYSVSMSISYTPWDMTSHDTIPYRCGGIQIWVQTMDSGYMSKIAYLRFMTIFGYHNEVHIHHNDLYARPEGVRERSGWCPKWSTSWYTGVSSYSRVVFQVSRWPDLGPFHDVWKWVQNSYISCIWRVPETSWDMMSRSYDTPHHHVYHMDMPKGHSWGPVGWRMPPQTHTEYHTVQRGARTCPKWVHIWKCTRE